jgi:hypothetical protein
VAEVAARLAGRPEDPAEFTDQLRGELVEDEVFVFTPKGEVKSLATGATPLDFAYEIHTDVGHRCVGARVNGKIVPLHYELQSGDIVEIMTSKRERGPSRDWLALVKTTRARNKIKAWFKAESREDSEHTGRELLQEHLHKAGLPAQKLTGSPLLADVIRELGFKKADDFYIALGAAKVSPKVVVNKVMQRLKQGEAGVEEPTPARTCCSSAARRPRCGARTARRPSSESRSRAWPTCRSAREVLPPGVGDKIVGYVSLGAASRSTATTARTWSPCARTRSASSRSSGTARTRPASRSRSRSTRGIATACSRTSRARSPRRDQHRRGALPRPAPDDPQPLRDRGGGHAGAEVRDLPPARDRQRVRRLSRDPRRRVAPWRPASTSSRPRRSSVAMLAVSRLVAAGGRCRRCSTASPPRRAGVVGAPLGQHPAARRGRGSGSRAPTA